MDVCLHYKYSKWLLRSSRMANICPQSGHTSVLINTSLQKGTTLAGSLVAKRKRIQLFLDRLSEKCARDNPER